MISLEILRKLNKTCRPVGCRIQGNGKIWDNPHISGLEGQVAMPSIKLENVGGAKIGGGSKKVRELSFIQVSLHFLWNISELPIRLLFVFCY